MNIGERRRRRRKGETTERKKIGTALFSFHPTSCAALLLEFSFLLSSTDFCSPSLCPILVDKILKPFRRSCRISDRNKSSLVSCFLEEGKVNLPFDSFFFPVMDSSSQAELEKTKEAWSLMTVVLLGAAVTLLVFMFIIAAIARLGSSSSSSAAATAAARNSSANGGGGVGGAGIGGGQRDNNGVIVKAGVGGDGCGSGTLINKAFQDGGFGGGSAAGSDAGTMERENGRLISTAASATAATSTAMMIDKSPDVIPHFNGEQTT